MGGSHKGLKGVILCVLVLGLVLLEQVQAEPGKSCCKDVFTRNCYNMCRFSGSTKQFCAKGCGCIIIGGTGCPANYPRLHTHSVDSDTPNAIEFCNMGCMSSVCGATNNEAEIDVELCGSACASFCNKIDVGASAAA